MNREQKSVEVEKLKALFAKAQLAVLTDYKGLRVNEFNDLRRKLEAKGSHMKVVKNRLAKIALKGTPLEIIASQFVGTVAVTTSEKDPVGPAKVLLDFNKDREVPMAFKGGAVNGKAITFKEVELLAKLSSREEMLAKLLGSMQAPARNWVSVLAQIPRRLVTVLAAVRDKKGNC